MEKKLEPEKEKISIFDKNTFLGVNSVFKQMDTLTNMAVSENSLNLEIYDKRKKYMAKKVVAKKKEKKKVFIEDVLEVVPQKAAVNIDTDNVKCDNPFVEKVMKNTTLSQMLDLDNEWKNCFDEPGTQTGSKSKALELNAVPKDDGGNVDFMLFPETVFSNEFPDTLTTISGSYVPTAMASGTVQTEQDKWVPAYAIPIDPLVEVAITPNKKPIKWGAPLNMYDTVPAPNPQTIKSTPVKKENASAYYEVKTSKIIKEKKDYNVIEEEIIYNGKNLKGREYRVVGNEFFSPRDNKQYVLVKVEGISEYISIPI